MSTDEETEGPPSDHIHDRSCWYLDCELFDVNGESAEPDEPTRTATGVLAGDGLAQLDISERWYPR
jgi:hypothetical protein